LHKDLWMHRVDDNEINHRLPLGFVAHNQLFLRLIVGACFPTAPS
jgi:hypothetical protein